MWRKPIDIYFLDISFSLLNNSDFGFFEEDLLLLFSLFGSLRGFDLKISSYFDISYWHEASKSIEKSIFIGLSPILCEVIEYPIQIIKFLENVLNTNNETVLNTSNTNTVFNT